MFSSLSGTKIRLRTILPVGVLAHAALRQRQRVERLLAASRRDLEAAANFAVDLDHHGDFVDGQGGGIGFEPAFDDVPTLACPIRSHNSSAICGANGASAIGKA